MSFLAGARRSARAMSQGRAGRKRAWECIGRREDADRERARDLERAGLLSSWNARVEAALVCLFTQAMQAGEGLDGYAVPPALLEEGSVPLRHWWGQWLWGCDPMQACSVNAPMNECQLHGLLVARSLVALYPAVMTDGVGLQDVFGASSRLCLGPGPVSGLNVRELKDCVLNLRQNWAAERGWEAPGAKDALMLILARLGVLSSTVMPSTSVCDDEYLQPCRGRKAVEMTRAGVRRVLNVVMALFRSMHVHGAAQEWSPSGEGEVQRVSKHHIFAGVDDFAGLSMQWDLPPAAVLNYVHDFPGARRTPPRACAVPAPCPSRPDRPRARRHVQPRVAGDLLPEPVVREAGVQAPERGIGDGRVLRRAAQPPQHPAAVPGHPRAAVRRRHGPSPGRGLGGCGVVVADPGRAGVPGELRGPRGLPQQLSPRGAHGAAAAGRPKKRV